MALLTCQSLPSYIKIPSKLVQILKKEKQQQARGSSYKEYNPFFQLDQNPFKQEARLIISYLCYCYTTMIRKSQQ